MKYKTYTVEEWLPYAIGLVIFCIIVFAFFVGYYWGYSMGVEDGIREGLRRMCNCTYYVVVP